MIRSDEQWLATIHTFHSAAIGGQSWETALRGFADATGSRSAQLTGVGQDGSVLFNVLTNMDPPAFHSMFAATAAINPRVKAASAAPVLKVMAEADFITPEQCRRGESDATRGRTALGYPVHVLRHVGETGPRIHRVGRHSFGPRATHHR